MQFEKLLNDEDKLLLAFNRNVLYRGTWKDFNLGFGQIGWETTLPKGYDNDDLKWYIEEVILNTENLYDIYLISQPPVTRSVNSPGDSLLYKMWILRIERG